MEEKTPDPPSTESNRYYYGPLDEDDVQILVIEHDVTDEIARRALRENNNDLALAKVSLQAQSIFQFHELSQVPILPTTTILG